jgi:creatinine amidohydrolase/Fe(II)-dependent formamide hydrolase-like protein
MRFPGTITLPEEHYRKVLEHAARSFKVNGFKDIVFIGDSGGNQSGMKAVTEMLNKEWTSTDVRVHFIPEYYSGTGFDVWLRMQGEKQEDIGSHAGITDTSQLWAVNPDMIRRDRFAPNGGFQGSGVTGNPTRASITYGRKGLELKIETAVSKIKESIAKK